MDTKNRLATIKERIGEAAIRSGRDPAEITLIAVSKTFPTTAVSDMASLGQVHFGENKIQELIQKTDKLGDGNNDHPIDWHFIGHLQRNKAKDLINRTSLFHGLDSFRLANALQSRLEKRDSTLNCLVQVNVSGEASKFGVEPSQLDLFIDQLSAIGRLKILGLMTLASPVDNPEDARGEFAEMKRLAESVGDRFHTASVVLSMGMSADFEVAIEEGATHVRIGSALFGVRHSQNT